MNFLVQQTPAFVYTGGRSFDPALKSVVFVHGAGNDHSVWTALARYFAHHGFNALAIDLPGHGKSQSSACASIGAYADWLAELLDQGGIGQAYLVGHSMGSLIALDLAIRYPHRAGKLALLGCSVPMPVAPLLLDAAQHRPHEAYDMLTLWGHAPQAKWGSSPLPGTVLLMAYRRLLEKCREGVLACDLAACNEYAIGPEALAQIKASTLVLSGGRDLMTPPKANQALAAAIPGARLVTLPLSGHSLMQEAPNDTLDSLADFLRP